jgi:voltage-gated potassium channel
VSPSSRRVAQGLTFFLLAWVAGVVGSVAAGWSAADALYVRIVTGFGVGYGAVRPVAGPELRGFTIFVIVGGHAAAICAIGGFVRWPTEGEVDRALWVRRP